MQISSRSVLWNSPESLRATVLVVRSDEARRSVRIAGGALAPGSSGVTVDWGDGCVQRLASFMNATHEYRRPGEHTVTISDDLVSFGYSSNVDTDANRQTLAELVRIGDRVTAIGSYAFNNCRSMRGVIELPNVTSLGNYAFGSTGGVTSFSFPSLDWVPATPFYILPSATSMYVDSAQQITSELFGYFGNRLIHVYIRKKTGSQVAAMTFFPFGAGPNARFHCSDVVIGADGRPAIC